MVAVSGLEWCTADPPCGHLAMHHDIYEPGDPYPTCCASDCRCGQPGEAVLQRQAGGVVIILSADPVIRVSKELLNSAEGWVWDGETLVLDTAGEYRYQYLRPDPATDRVLIFGRVRP